MRFLFLCLFLCFLPLILTRCDQPAPEVPQEMLKEGTNPAEGLVPPVIEKPQDKAIIPFTVSPAAVDFGTISEIEDSQRSVGITNSTDSPVTFASLALFGANEHFSFKGSCKEGEVIPARQSCMLDITYAPLEAASHQAEIVIQPKAGLPAKIILTGTAETVSLPPPSEAAQKAANTNQYRQQLPITIYKSDAGDTIPLINTAPSHHYPPSLFPNTTSSLPIDRSRIITADRYIPAVLENTIHSELSGGRIIAVVERNVYGSDGRLVLIPASSRVIGTYSSLQKQGDTRLAVKWHRVIRPDGASIALSAEGADTMGRLGLIGNVDSRFIPKYGSSILTSFLSVLPEYFAGGDQTSVTANSSTTEQTTGKSRAVSNFSKDMSFLARRMIDENIQLEPIVTIPQGTRLLIIPSEDIYLAAPGSMVPLAHYEESGTGKVAKKENLEIREKKEEPIKNPPRVELYKREEG